MQATPKPVIRAGDIIEKVKRYNPEADATLISRAFDFARDAHEGQKRRSGEPFFTHPFNVSSIISDLHLDIPSVCAGLLHV